MATTIKLKSGSGVPLAGDLVAAEPAFDLTNKRLYTEDSGGTVIEVGTNPSTLTVDTDTLVVDAANNRVGIGTSSPESILHIEGSGIDSLRFGNIGASSNTALRISRDDTSIISGNPLGYLEFGGKDTTSNADTAHAYIAGVASGTHDAGDNPTDLTFGTTPSGSSTISERLRIDSSGNVGIGTTSPNEPLTIETAGAGLTSTINLRNTESSDNPRGGTIVYNVNNGSTQTNAVFLQGFKAGNTSAGGIFTISTADSSWSAPAERMRIDSSGNVGIGTSSPASILHLQESGTSTDAKLRIAGTNANGDASNIIEIGATQVVNNTSSAMTFATRSTGTLTERMRIDSSGHVLIGRSSTAASATDYGMNLYSSGIIYLFANAAGNDDIFRGHNSAGTNTSAIEADGDYIDLSDSRFKQNIVDAPSVINTIKSIPVRSFDWKDRSYGQTYGFVAQELNGICPEVVKVPESEEDVWGVRNSKVVPMLVKAVQEQQAMIEELKAEVAALKGA